MLIPIWKVQELQELLDVNTIKYVQQQIISKGYSIFNS